MRPPFTASAPVTSRHSRSPATYLEASAVVAVGLAAGGDVLRLWLAGVDVSSGIVLVGALPILAGIAATGLLLSRDMLRLAIIAGAIGGMVVMIVVAPMAVAFVVDRVYLQADLLIWLFAILLLAAFAAAWRESQLDVMWVALMLTAGGVSGLLATGFAFWAVIVVALLLHPI